MPSSTCESERPWRLASFIACFALSERRKRCTWLLIATLTVTVTITVTPTTKTTRRGIGSALVVDLALMILAKISSDRQFRQRYPQTSRRHRIVIRSKAETMSST
jgi:hypothetical protein